MHLCWKFALMMMVLVCLTAGYHHPKRVAVTCCEKVSKGRIPAEYKVTKFQHLNALGQCVEAIVFYTEKGTFCSDPKAPWVQEKLKGLKERMK